jgi:hypothetical protein
VCAAVKTVIGAVIQTSRGVGMAAHEIPATGQVDKNTIYGDTGLIEVHVLQAPPALLLLPQLSVLVMFGVVLPLPYVLETSHPVLQLMQTPQHPIVALQSRVVALAAIYWI